MLEFFPDNYNWSLAVALAIGMGGELTEIDAACGPLRPLAASATSDEAQATWIEAWSNLADRVRATARTADSAGHVRSAARAWRRVAVYELMAERMISNVDPAKNATYGHALDALTRWRHVMLPECETVEVGFDGSVLPSLYVPAAGRDTGRTPAVIAWNGFDVTKEFLLLMGVDEWARRGIAVLICDQPGSGEALRFHGLTARLDTEVVAAACIDALSARPDVDATRIGVVGISMGGYYAPRAAAFEPRLAACAAWGAFHDMGGVLANLAETNAHSAPPFQAPWVFGIDDPTRAAELVTSMNLDASLAHVRCPLLVLHGAADRQVPVTQARRTYDHAVHAPRRDLVVIPQGSPGDQHCQVDQPSIAIDVLGDWFAEVLL